LRKGIFPRLDEHLNRLFSVNDLCRKAVNNSRCAGVSNVWHGWPSWPARGQSVASPMLSSIKALCDFWSDWPTGQRIARALCLSWKKSSETQRRGGRPESPVATRAVDQWNSIRTPPHPWPFSHGGEKGKRSVYPSAERRDYSA
jgi:hypothetical protein